MYKSPHSPFTIRVCVLVPVPVRVRLLIDISWVQAQLQFQFGGERMAQCFQASDRQAVGGYHAIAFSLALRERDSWHITYVLTFLRLLARSHSTTDDDFPRCSIPCNLPARICCMLNCSTDSILYSISNIVCDLAMSRLSMHTHTQSTRFSHTRTHSRNA